MTRTLLHPLDNSGLCRAVGSGAQEDTQHERDEREELPVRHPATTLTPPAARPDRNRSQGPDTRWCPAPAARLENAS